jgi:hypothetical protein
MATNKSSAGSRRAAARSAAAIPEPMFRSAVWIGAIALLTVLCILISGLINSH